MENKFFYEGFDFKTQRCEYVTITPDIAREFLEHNTNNRPKKLANIKRMAEDMKNGKWYETTNSIGFDVNGLLPDGQNRLYAIIEADKPITMRVIFGLPVESFKYTDIGQKRTFGDVLSAVGRPNYLRAASIVKAYLHLVDGYRGSRPSSNCVGQKFRTNAELFEAYNKNCEFFDNIAHISSNIYKIRRLLNVSEIGSIMAYLIMYKGKSMEMVEDFFNCLCGNQFTDRTNVVLMLQDRLIRDRTANNKLTALAKNQLIAKAWNCYVSKRSLKTLNFDKTKETIEFI